MTKNGPKLGFLDFLGKSVRQILTGNCVEWKYLWPFDILQKLHKLDKSGSQGIAENAVAQSDFSCL